MIENTPENIKSIRKKMHMTQKELAAVMGYTVRSWQTKETTNAKLMRNLNDGEFAYLLLLAGEHPDFVMTPRTSD